MMKLQRSRRLLWVVLAVGILALLTSSRVLLSLEIKGYGAPIADILAGEALRWSLWLPVLPLVLAVERRWGFATAPWPRAIAVHMLGATAVLLTQSLVMTAAGGSAGWYFALGTQRERHS